MGTFTNTRAKSGAWESVPTKGVPAGGGCASSFREKGEWTHCLPDKSPARGAHAGPRAALPAFRLAAQPPQAVPVAKFLLEYFLGPHPCHLQPGHLPPLPLRPSVSSLNACSPPLGRRQLLRPTKAGSASVCPSARGPQAPSPGSFRSLRQGTRSPRTSL